MPDGTHQLGAGQRSAGDTKHYLFLLAGALGADGGADRLVSAERASLIHSGSVEIDVFVYLLKNLLVEEKQPVIVVTLEHISFLDLLKHQRGNMLASSYMSSELSRVFDRTLAQLLPVRTVEIDLEVGYFLKLKYLRAPQGATIVL